MAHCKSNGQEDEGTAAGECATPPCTGCPESRKASFERHRSWKLLSPERRRTAVEHAREQGLSERQACRLVNQPRDTQRYQPTQRSDEDELTKAIIVLASEYGRYGYRSTTALLNQVGWHVGKDRVQRIWRREGLKVPTKQKPEEDCG